MDQQGYDDLKQQIENQYQKSIREAKTRRHNDLFAIKTVWRMTNPLQQTSPDKNYGLFMTAILDAIQLLPVDTVGFTKNDVKQVIKKTLPEVAIKLNECSLSSNLIRLAKQGAIRVVVAGRGRSPSVYCKV